MEQLLDLAIREQGKILWWALGGGIVAFGTVYLLRRERRSRALAQVEDLPLRYDFYALLPDYHDATAGTNHLLRLFLWMLRPRVSIVILALLAVAIIVLRADIPVLDDVEVVPRDIGLRLDIPP